MPPLSTPDDRLLAAQQLAAKGDREGALSILSELVREGHADFGTFEAYRALFRAQYRRDLAHADVFNWIYRSDAWEGGSGPGSTIDATRPYREFLENFIRTNGIRSVVDVGCGDWQSSHLIDWQGADYTGLDVSSIALEAASRYAKPGIRFMEADARSVEIPAADLLLIKDVMQHWSNADILAVLPKLHPYRYCLITNGVGPHAASEVNADGRAGGFRPIDLSQPPFSLTGHYVLKYDLAFVTKAGPQSVVMRTFQVEHGADKADSVKVKTKSPPPMFAHEYDLAALHLIKPRGRDFSLYVTPRYLEHYQKEEYERLSAKLVSSLVRRCDLFVDIGSSYGFYSLLAAKQRPDLEIIAVEPTPTTAAILRRSVELTTASKIAVKEAAVSDEVGTRQFNVALASDSCGFFDHPNVETLETIDVETTTVDAMLRDRAPCRLLLKIDTEGNELAVLAGMRETLARFPDVRLMVEYCPNVQRAAGHEPAELLRVLDELGFVAYLIDEGRQRYYRVRQDDDVLNRTDRDYANLYCVRKTAALSVCFVAHSSGLAGSERVLLELIDDLVVEYGAVCSVMMPAEGPLATAIANAGAAPIIVPFGWWAAKSGHRAELAATITRSVDSIKHVSGDIRAFDPDVFWSQTMVVPWGAMMAATMRKPHVWYVTEFGEVDHGLKFQYPLSQTTQYVMANSDHVYTASQIVKAVLFARTPEDKVSVLYCNPRADTGAKRADHVYKREGAIRLGMFATVTPSKGQQDLLLAAAELAHRGHDVEVLLAGQQDPAFRRTLDHIIAQTGLAGRVQMPGHLTNQYGVMAATDIIVVCSRNEAFGRTGVEAMQLGKPVVYPVTGGMVEYCINGKTGLSYVPGNVGMLVQQLEKLVVDAALRDRLGASGRRRASELFTADRFSGTAYRQLIALRDSGRTV